VQRDNSHIKPALFKELLNQFVRSETKQATHPFFWEGKSKGKQQLKKM
jgi:hypothetical protein